MFPSLDRWLLHHTPPWARTPYMQTVGTGLVFFFVFASYTTIQFYSRTTYGERLAANSVASVYASFTGACMIAPSVTNRYGARATMLLGIAGYASLVTASLLYFLYGVEWVVVMGGAVLGIGAALLWTAQGRLIMDYAKAGGDGTGKLMGTFWAVFQCSSLVGGAISFVYYSHKPTGSVGLYVIFLVFILMGAFATQLLLPPEVLEAEALHKRTDDNLDTAEILRTEEEEKEPLSPAAQPSEDTQLLGEALEIEEQSLDTEDDISWRAQVQRTFQIFRTRPMLILSTLFFYTGFNQPYQQATFGNRFFTKRTIGVELIIFHLMEIIGAIYCGRALDGTGQSTAGNDEIQKRAQRKRTAIVCLSIFIAVNTTGNLLALQQEFSPEIVAADITDGRSLFPSLAFACWGFADSQIQVYSYWLISALYDTGGDHARAVGFFKCIQSLGVAVGFYLTPLTRLSALCQLGISTTFYVLGTGLSFLQLPP